MPQPVTEERSRHVSAELAHGAEGTQGIEEVLEHEAELGLAAAFSNVFLRSRGTMSTGFCLSRQVCLDAPFSQLAS